MKQILPIALVLLWSADALAQSPVPSPDTAQQTARARTINTGGENGAYHSLFCPPFPPALARFYFTGYACTPSRGTLENITRALAAPGAIGFAQLDVYSREAARRPDEFRRLTVIRRDIACEGLWMITRNEQLNNLGDVQGFARRMTFILPPAESGSSASFDYLREMDPEGLGTVPAANIRRVANATEVINEVAASTNGAVGFFVQFADPTNANIRLLVERNLRIVPVVSRELLRARVDDQAVYEVQEFNLSEGGVLGIGGRARTATTACTPVAVFTATPEALPAGSAQADQRDLIQRLREVPSAQLLPQQSAVARLIAGARRVSQGAVETMVTAADTAKRAAQRAVN